MGCVCLTAATLWSSKVILDNYLICWWVWVAEIRLPSMWHYFTGQKIYKSPEEEKYKQTMQREKHENLPQVPQNYVLLAYQAITLAPVLKYRYRYKC